jgi:mitogen-activated protein kinase 7
MSYQGRTVNKVYGQDFIIDKNFRIVKQLGHGAYGIVCSARFDDGLSASSSTEHGDTDVVTTNSTADGSYVAIKKITNIFSKKILCKRSLRELKLLQFFRGHKNITCLYDLDIALDPVTGDFNDVYLYEELMECDMHQIIRSGQSLTDSHFQSFIYQILCGVKYIHSADVLHRDLKPGNILVNADCELKICDFGLARGFLEDPEKNAGFMTEYVATRWYRAPEIMLSFTNYTKAIDIWSVGCILAELLGGKPLFRGKDYVDQLNQILLILGTPKESTLTKIGSTRAQNYVRSLPLMKKVPYSELFPNANPLALDLLEKMLTLDPYERITVEEALKHPYLAIWHDPQDEPVCQVKFDFKSFETVDSMDTMKQLILEEVANFREFARKPIEEQQQIQLQIQVQQRQRQEQERRLQEEQKRAQELLQQQQIQQQQQLEQQQREQQRHLHEHPRDHEHHQHQQHPLEIDQNRLNQEHYNSRIYHQNYTPSTAVNTSNLENAESNFTVPKPQELDEFTFNNQELYQENFNLGDMNQNDLFRLEEELGFGLDGTIFYSNQ